MTTLLLTNHDLARAVSGYPIICTFDTGDDALLRFNGTPVVDECLADQRALRDNLPIVSVSADEAYQVATGHTVLTTAANFAGAVQVRYMTPDELLDAHAAAVAKLGMEPNLTRAKAEELTRAQ